jgi:hypothetical protein
VTLDIPDDLAHLVSCILLMYINYDLCTLCFMIVIYVISFRAKRQSKNSSKSKINGPAHHTQ